MKEIITITLSNSDISRLLKGEELIFNNKIRIKLGIVEMTYGEFVNRLVIASDFVAPGRLYIPIYKVRRFLNLSYSDFDCYLKKMRSELKIQLNPSNRGDLTEDELRDCFIDEFGDVFITFCWR